MLALVERYLDRIRQSRSDADIMTMLAELAADHGYRSAFMIEYATSMKTAVHLIDTDASREGWWDYYVSSGIRTSVEPLQEIIRRGVISYLDENTFCDRDGAELAFFRRLDMADCTIVPISFDQEALGTVGFCGATRLDVDQERALLFICYSMFSQVRSFRNAGGKAVASALTPREREVMELSAEGLTSQEVAEQLGVSARTVNQHVDNVAFKLGTKNRTHTVAEAIRRDLL